MNGDTEWATQLEVFKSWCIVRWGQGRWHRSLALILRAHLGKNLVWCSFVVASLAIPWMADRKSRSEAGCGKDSCVENMVIPKESPACCLRKHREGESLRQLVSWRPDYGPLPPSAPLPDVENESPLPPTLAQKFSAHPRPEILPFSFDRGHMPSRRTSWIAHSQRALGGNPHSVLVCS